MIEDGMVKNSSPGSTRTRSRLRLLPTRPAAALEASPTAATPAIIGAGRGVRLLAVPGGGVVVARLCGAIEEEAAEGTASLVTGGVDSLVGVETVGAACIGGE